MEKLIPENHQIMMPYLIVNGAEKFISFTKTVFGAEETYKSMRDENRIQHAELNFKGCTLMVSDATQNVSSKPGSFFIYVPNADETFKLALDQGATIISPVENQSYGRSGGVEDPFGNIWWITSLAG